jgi:hypothetical protein
LDDVDREDGSYGLPKILEGRECLKTSGSTSAWDSCSIVEEEEGGARFLTVVADFSARRLTACLDSWKKKAPSFPANLPARKLIAAFYNLLWIGRGSPDEQTDRFGEFGFGVSRWCFNIRYDNVECGLVK